MIFDPENDDPLTDLKIRGRELKILLYNTKTEQFIGNAVRVKANWSVKSKEVWSFKDEKNSGMFKTKYQSVYIQVPIEF